MTPDETVDLLTLAAAFDQRTVGEGDAFAWQAVVGDLRFIDARQAVIAYYTENRERIMPSDVRQRVREMRNERIRVAGGVPAPPAELIDYPRAYSAALHAAAVALGDGRPVEAAEQAMQAIARQAARLELEAS